ncbi:MAG: response regulator transcription factor [Lactobacillales bacterium]|jgi:two-component system phosphate regulon response regulator OmpR|nr:response regulator transcription factor [Lactobacillales bacterium]
MEKKHILVIDDDNRLRKLLRKYLLENDFNVSEASDTREARALLDLFVFDILILDIMMPGQNGLDFTKQLRSENFHTPILMLTAIGDTDNRILGLENGADDYLSKPFEPKELLLRIQNILKRNALNAKKERVLFGECDFNPQTGILLKSNTPVSLTTTDALLLRILSQNIGTPVTREKLGQALETDNLRTVDVQITRLRKKIETPGQPQCLQSVRGQGYTLVPK